MLDDKKRVIDCYVDEFIQLIKEDIVKSVKEELKEDEHKTTLELCRIINRSEETVNKYHNEYGMPKVDHNKWHVPTCLNWIRVELPKIKAKIKQERKLNQ